MTEARQRWLADNAEKVRGYKRKWRENNKEVSNEQHRIRMVAWRAEYPNKVIEAKAKYKASNPHQYVVYYSNNREAILEKQSAYRLSNPENIKKARIKWSKANPDKIRVGWHNRRVREGRGTFTAWQFEEVCNYYGWKCLCCGNTEPVIALLGYKLVPDHVIPLSKEGSNTIDNIQPLCSLCNGKKHVKHTDYRNQNAEERNN